MERNKDNLALDVRRIVDEIGVSAVTHRPDRPRIPKNRSYKVPSSFATRRSESKMSALEIMRSSFNKGCYQSTATWLFTLLVA